MSSEEEKQEKLVVFTADIPEFYAEIFDDWAKENLRSRQAHLRFVIQELCKKYRRTGANEV